MSEDSVEARRLDSWKEIAAYIGRSVRTVIRWEHLNGLPVHRLPGGQRQGVYAWRHEIDEWLQSDQREQDNEPETAEDLPEPEEAEEAELETVPPPRPRWFRAHIGWLHGIVAATALLVVGAFAAHSLMIPRRMKISDVAQITSDGIKKYGLATNGTYLYFGEALNGKIVLSQVPVGGGRVSTIATPFPSAIPLGISPDGDRLLVTAVEGEEEDHPLWIVPVKGGTPRRMGNVLCHAASWAPDGRRIAFASGNSIYMTRDEGATTERIQEFAGIPQQLEWFSHGRQLIVELQQEGSDRSDLWSLVFDGEGSSSKVFTLSPLNVNFEQCCHSLSAFDHEGKLFYSSGRMGNRISLLKQSWSLSNSRPTPGELGSQMAHIGWLEADPGAKKLYVLGNIPGNGELLRLDRGTNGFKPFLAGMEATEVDYSTDRKWITYIGQKGDGIWISRPDGSARRRIKFEADDVDYPRWSPDGRSIAFIGHVPGRPWRVFVTPAQGGSVREASVGNEKQGSPSWSPDGKRLLYGRVDCRQLQTCGIEMIDLSTGQVSSIPGSEGMGTARWSPDGRFVAAIQPATHQIFLLDMATHQWRKLADGMNGWALNWAPDSRSLYTSNPNGDAPAVYRIWLKDNKVETALDLSGLSRLPGSIAKWFGVTPDGSIIVLRWLSGAEIFALDYDER